MAAAKTETSKHLTEAFLRKLASNGARREISDTVERGLRVRISKDGNVTFILKARNLENAVKTVTLGRYPDLSLKEARERAREARRALKDGTDINAAKRARRQQSENGCPGVTLGELVLEFEKAFRGSHKMWEKAGPRTERSQARRCIEAVFADLLSEPAEALKPGDLAKTMSSYRPKRQKTSANGQVSRARAYLMAVLDWGACRKRFAKVGGGRSEPLALPDLAEVFDPAKIDRSLAGERDRVLFEEELRAVLPMLVYPAPVELGLKLDPKRDFRPIAMRFILLTAARREEVVRMQRKEIDVNNCVWRKPEVKSTRGGPRGQNLPLSQAALELLLSLPHFKSCHPDDLVFPNSVGGLLGNWRRLQDAIFRASGTEGWHRHDLRRTAATLMQTLGVPVFVVDQILAHSNPLRRADVSSAASSYIRLTKVLRNTRDPQAEALDRLAEVLETIEKGTIGGEVARPIRAS